MDFSFLPSEIIEEVAEYLSLDDINACSMVSRQWRRAFDNDRIWKRHYTFHQNYFDKQVTKRKNLSVGCKSKTHVFREMQVRKNLVNGKYGLVQVDIGSLYCDNLLDVVDEVGNHWLFISCSMSNELSWHKIKVWNMNDKPIEHGSMETPLRYSRHYNSQMKFIKDKLYYIVDDNVIAFKFSRPQYRLTELFLFKDCPRQLLTEWPNKSEIAMVCKPNMVLMFMYTSAHMSMLIEPWVFVWAEDKSLLYTNITNNDQIIIDPNHCLEPFLKVNDGGSSDNVLLVYKPSCQAFTVVLFNVKTFKYSTVFVELNAKFIFSDLNNEVVILFYQQILNECSTRSFNSKLSCHSIDGNVFFQLCQSQCSNSHCSIVTGNEGKEVLIFDAKGYFTVFDVFERKMISSFRIQGFQSDVSLVINNLIMVQEQKRTKSVLAVWDYKRGKRLYDFPQLQSVYSFAFTKSYRSPPKIFGIEDPQVSYARSGDGVIVVISFL